jgi:preprotein translocase subunit SecG
MNTLATILEANAKASTATVFTWILGVVVILLAIGISVVVAMQSTQEGGLSGTISGGSSDSFFGKSKTMTKDRLLSRITLIASIVFVVLVLALVILVSSTMGA